MASAMVDQGPRTADMQQFIEAGGKQQLPSAPPLAASSPAGEGAVPLRQAGAPPAAAAAGGGGMGVGAGERFNPGAQIRRVTEGQGTTAAKLAAGIIAIGQMLSAMIIKTGEAASNAIQGYAEERIATTRPSMERLSLSNTFVTRLGYAAKLTSPGASLLTTLAGYLGDISYWFVLWAARIYEQLTGHGSGRSLAGGNGRGAGMLSADELQAFKLVGAALLVAYAGVYDALEGAARVVFLRAAGAGQRYVAHKYGEDAATAATQGLQVSQDLMTITLNWFRLTGRALISATAHGSARDFLRAHVANLSLE